MIIFNHISIVVFEIPSVLKGSIFLVLARIWIHQLTSSDGVMLIDGVLKSLTSEWEIESKLKLSEGRNAHLVILIPEEMTNCQ